jgi:hypothetical protein
LVGQHGRQVVRKTLTRQVLKETDRWMNRHADRQVIQRQEERKGERGRGEREREGGLF